MSSFNCRCCRLPLYLPHAHCFAVPSNQLDAALQHNILHKGKGVELGHTRPRQAVVGIGYVLWLLIGRHNDWHAEALPLHALSKLQA